MYSARKSKADIGLETLATKEGRDELASPTSEYSADTLRKSFNFNFYAYL